MPRLTHHPEVVCTELEEGGVLLHLGTRTYYSLNASALEIWRLVHQSEDVEALGRALTTRFDVEAGQARAVAAAFVERLRAEQLVVETEEVDMPTPQAAAVSPLRKSLDEPQLLKHDEPLHEVPITPFDPQLPLAE
jgi:hypothetical protein